MQQDMFSGTHYFLSRPKTHFDWFLNTYLFGKSRERFGQHCNDNFQNVSHKTNLLFQIVKRFNQNIGKEFDILISLFVHLS